ncbi:MAG: polysaccharide deacetylase family protein [Acidobacteriia bacterium]|nr:polysaccharide deacetylase family protein [Terriglobia bacterium]
MGSRNRSDNRPILWVTTSWDDGYPLDTRLAELLHRYGVAATFYVPIRSQLPVMEPRQIRDLARMFDIGGHTVNHVRLDSVAPEAAREEIIQSKQMIEDITGSPCRMFCPPGGRYLRSHLDDVREAGYSGLRTVELMSVARPARRDGLMVMPTTLQLFPHGAAAYFKNALKRRRPENVKTYLLHGRRPGLPETVDSILDSLVESGGVFHLWGHSWEMEHSRLWGVLESVLKRLDAHRDRCRFVSNAALCEHFEHMEEAADVAPAGACAGGTFGLEDRAAR